MKEGVRGGVVNMGAKRFVNWEKPKKKARLRFAEGEGDFTRQRKGESPKIRGSVIDKSPTGRNCKWFQLCLPR